MKEKFLSLLALASLGLSPLALSENKLCPIMIEDEAYEDEVAEYEGKTVQFAVGLASNCGISLQSITSR